MVRMPVQYQSDEHTPMDVQTILEMHPQHDGYHWKYEYGILLLQKRFTTWRMDTKRIVAYFEHPDCPFMLCLLTGRMGHGGYTVAFKPIEQQLFLDTQLFFKKMIDMDPTEIRARLNDDTSRALAIKRSKALAKAEMPSIEKIRRGLDEEQRLTYVKIKSEIIELELAGKIQTLSDLERERLTLLRMVELDGLMHMLTSPGSVMSVREVAAYVELTRKMGNEGQKMADSVSAVKQEKKSTFTALEELVKQGFKVELTKRPDTIDADFTALADDKSVPSPEPESGSA